MTSLILGPWKSYPTKVPSGYTVVLLPRSSSYYPAGFRYEEISNSILRGPYRSVPNVGLSYTIVEIPMQSPLWNLGWRYYCYKIPAPSPAPAPSNPSGQAPPGAIAGWNQIFVDDFNYTVNLGQFPSAVASTWGKSYPDGWKDTSKNGTYKPSEVVSVGASIMNLYIHTNSAGEHCVAAPVPTLPGATGSEGGLTSGIYVVRFKADPIPGYKTAWLLWPDSETWPRDGEIDFPEGNLNDKIYGFVHHQGATGGSDQDTFSTGITYSDWHTAKITWISGQSVTFELDGNIVGTTTTRIPNTPMHWVLQTETWLNGIVPDPTVSGNVQIDWVAVYTR